MPHRSTPALALSTSLLLWCANSAFALDPSKLISQYAHTAWGQTGSLFGKPISAISQTQGGDLWLGTEGAGLFRFDGARFIPLDARLARALGSDLVPAIQGADDGALWIGTRSGLSVLKDGQITSLAKPEGINAGAVTTIQKDRDNVFWAGTYGVHAGGFFRIDHSRTEVLNWPGGPDARGIYVIHRARAGSLWVGGEAGLIRWDSPPAVVMPKDPFGQIVSIAEAADGSLWLATSLKKLLNYSPQKGVTAESLAEVDPQAQPYRVLVDRDGGLWVGTRGQGLLHRTAGHWSRMSRADGLSGDRIIALFEDREGNIWVGTENGLDRFREYKVATYSTREGLPGSFVTSISAAKGGGVCMAVVGSGIYCLPAGQHRQSTNSTVFATLTDHAGHLVVATTAGVMLGETRSLGGLTSVYAMAEDSEHALWLGDSHQGLFRVKEGGNPEPVSMGTLAGEPISSLLADREGRLWIAYNHGAIGLFENESFRPFSSKDGLGAGYVASVFEDQAGSIWAATENGLSRYRDGRFATLTTRNGLPCDSVHDILEDDQGSFWIASNCGLIRAKLDGLDAAIGQNPAHSISVDVFGAADGFRATTLRGTTPHAAKSTDGRLWFTSEDGVEVVDPAHLPRNTVPPPVHIEQTLVDGKPFDSTRLIRLPPTVARIEFDYTALSFTDPDRVLFRYKLEGLDATWIDAGTLRQASYTNLRPGFYKFRVIACNNDGVWNEAGASLSLEIDSAFLQTELFSWLASAMGLMVVWYAYRFRDEAVAGFPLAKLFRAYPTGIPGYGLLLLRLVVGVALLTRLTYGVFRTDPGSIGSPVSRLLEAGCGVLLIAGLLTPYVGTLLISVTLMEMVRRAAADPVYASFGGAWQYASIYLAVMIALTLLGPGGYSFDARFLGRRVVIVPRPKPKSPSISS